MASDEDRQVFYGWLELAAALERMRLPEAGDGPVRVQATLLGDFPVARDSGSS